MKLKPRRSDVNTLVFRLSVFALIVIAGCMWFVASVHLGVAAADVPGRLGVTTETVTRGLAAVALAILGVAVVTTFSRK